MSYFLNEFSETPAEIARALMRDWQKHLSEEGIVILVEPALRLQSHQPERFSVTTAVPRTCWRIERLKSALGIER